MRHDTTTTPTSAPASTIAPSPSARIDALERELHCLHAQRAGRLEAGPGLGPVHGLRPQQHFPLDGEDTCCPCIAELTKRAGRQP